jgi:hypothetical protein
VPAYSYRTSRTGRSMCSSCVRTFSQQHRFQHHHRPARQKQCIRYSLQRQHRFGFNHCTWSASTRQHVTAPTAPTVPTANQQQQQQQQQQQATTTATTVCHCSASKTDPNTTNTSQLQQHGTNIYKSTTHQRSRCLDDAGQKQCIRYRLERHVNQLDRVGVSCVST